MDLIVLCEEGGRRPTTRLRQLHGTHDAERPTDKNDDALTRAALTNGRICGESEGQNIMRATCESGVFYYFQTFKICLLFLSFVSDRCGCYRTLVRARVLSDRVRREIASEMVERTDHQCFYNFYPMYGSVSCGSLSAKKKKFMFIWNDMLLHNIVYID